MQPLRSIGVPSAVVLVAILIAPTLRGAELQENTLAAWEPYAARAHADFLRRAADRTSRWPDDPGLSPADLRAGGIVAGPKGGDGIMTVPGGLIHHWSAVTFMPGVTLERVLAVSQDYAAYADIYESIVAARVLDRRGDQLDVQLRLEEHAGPITAVMEVTSNVQYIRVNAARAYSLSESREVREVEDHGRPGERLLPPGEGRGYLWRVSTMSRYVERDGGVYVELETLGLTRGYPPLLGWIIEPIARRLGRKSVEGSLRELREALAVGDAGM
ncbi:MAG: hypothetical protein FJW23_09260 [Acidimicrobiia bacterium]|nr:hypothetical protein [Acidimicrobiia bacterium]